MRFRICDYFFLVFLVLNPSKCHILGSKTERAPLSFNGKTFDNSKKITIWYYSQAINSCFTIILKNFSKRLPNSSRLCQELHHIQTYLKEFDLSSRQQNLDMVISYLFGCFAQGHLIRQYKNQGILTFPKDNFDFG